MNRLQTLRECVYTQKTRTCTCYSVLLEAHAATDEGKYFGYILKPCFYHLPVLGMRFVFDSTPDCEVIHGALYSCLRAMFGLSVSGILVCIFSCMLVYQLLRLVPQFFLLKNNNIILQSREKENVLGTIRITLSIIVPTTWRHVG